MMVRQAIEHQCAVANINSTGVSVFSQSYANITLMAKRTSAPTL
jgi:hypothetical protein